MAKSIYMYYLSLAFSVGEPVDRELQSSSIPRGPVHKVKVKCQGQNHMRGSSVFSECFLLFIQFPSFMYHNSVYRGQASREMCEEQGVCVRSRL